MINMLKIKIISHITHHITFCATIFLFLFCLQTNTKESRRETFNKIFQEATQAFLAGNIENAIELYKKTLEITDKIPSVHFNLATAYYNTKNMDLATAHFNKALEINPDYHRAHQSLGVLYKNQKKHTAAIKHFKRATELNKNDFCSHMHYASILVLSKAYPQAEQYLKRIRPLFPNKQELLYDLAYVLKLQGKYEECIPYYRKVIDLDQGFEAAYLGVAKAYLATGDFLNGLYYFEWRFLQTKKNREIFKYEYLKPKHLAGKTVLLRKEWGLGDMMHFIRYAKLVKDLGATVHVQTHEPLEKLFSLCPYIDKIITKGSSAPPFNFQIPILSLPLIFRTTVDTIPADIPYLYADKTLVAHWKEKLAPDKNFKVGICWRAKPIFLEDNPLTKRSVPLKDFAALADIPNVSFYSLQKIFGTEELNETPPHFKVHTFGPDFDDTHGRFMDTAAVIQNLDLVITADTSIVHLAGALGKPVWILIPHVAEWRWLQDRKTTPWYPNARLFRQSKPIDWTHVMKEIKKELTSVTLKRKGEQ